MDTLEKEGRIRLLQRSIGQNHSRDSAIDTDLQVIQVGGCIRKEDKCWLFRRYKGHIRSDILRDANLRIDQY